MENNENFETKLQRVKELLATLNNPEITLEQSMEAYKEGVQTLKNASKMLEDAKLLYEELEKDEVSKT